MTSERKQQRVLIDALSPLILTSMSNSTVMTETKPAISGTILRGVFARRYIDGRGLGDDAQRDPAFRHLFFGGLRFVDANPVMAGERSIVLPLSLQKEKAEDGKSVPAIQDLLKERHPALGYKSLRGYAAVTEAGGIVPATVRTSIALHMSRSGAGERLIGSSRDGGIFNYESIDAGQQFEGAILGTEEDIAALLTGCRITDGTFHARIGRSRFTQYGSALFTLSACEDVQNDIAGNIQDNNIFLRLDTAYLPKEGFHTMPDARGWLAELSTRMGAGFSIGTVYAAGAEAENFVGIWKMKQPRAYGLAAGAVFELQKDRAWTDEDKHRLAAILTDGIGRRRAEGFGQLRVWPRREMTLAARMAGKASAVPIDEDIRAQVRRILQKKRMEQLRVYAYDDVEKMHGLGGKTHFFARLLSMLEKAEQDAAHGSDVRTNFQQAIAEQSQHDDGKIHAAGRAQTPLVKHLHEVDLGSTSLYELLAGDVPLPYEARGGRSWMQDIGGGKMQALMKDAGLSEADFPADGEAFYVYFQQVFRAARKKAAGDERRAGE